MKKKSVLRKVLATALTVAMLCGTGFTTVGQFIGTSGITVNADISKASDIPNHSVGVVGSFNGWDSDIKLTDADGDGIYEGVVKIDEVYSNIETLSKLVAVSDFITA